MQVIGDTDETGTEVTFIPDEKIFETTVFDFDILSKRLEELAYLNKNLLLEVKVTKEKPGTLWSTARVV